MIDLFDVEKFDVRQAGGAKPKPRQASGNEVRAYMKWLAAKAGLHAFETVTINRRGATFGDCDSASTYDPATRDYTTPIYETGAYSVALPGWNSERDKVTLETLDESGAVIASQTLPREPKKLGVIWDKATVARAVGPVDKPKRARKAKAAPIVAPPIVGIADIAPLSAEYEANASTPIERPRVRLRLVAVDVTPSEEIEAMPIEASLSPVEALPADLAIPTHFEAETSPVSDPSPILTQSGRGERSPAHVRAIMGYLELRRARRDKASQIAVWSRSIRDLERKLESMTEEAAYQRRKKELAREDATHLRESLASQAAVETLWKCIAGEYGYASKMADKRRRAVMRLRDMRQERVLDRAALEAGRLNYGALQERLADVTADRDRLMAGRSLSDVRSDDMTALLAQRSTLSAQFETERGKVTTFEARTDALSAELMSMTGRALRAETALAATTARINGWPPAVARVTFGKAA